MAFFAYLQYQVFVVHVIFFECAHKGTQTGLSTFPDHRLVAKIELTKKIFFTNDNTLQQQVKLRKQKELRSSLQTTCF